MKILKTIFFAGIYLFLLPGISMAAGLPVRISVKFILNPTTGLRPADPANINTNDEVTSQITRANEILANERSELRIEQISNPINIGGIGNAISNSWYSVAVTEVANLRTAAMADQTNYSWSTSAINIYINGSTGSGAAFSNNIILLGQGAWDTTVIHEIGHTLNLNHTHEITTHTTTANCDRVTWTSSDTIIDNSTWAARNDVVSGNSGASADAVDLVWWNVMSYHNANTRNRFSSCQKDKMSNRGYDERSWIYSNLLVYFYVDSNTTNTTLNGAFTTPFQRLRDALNATGINSRAIMLQEGTYAAQGIIAPLDNTNKVNFVPRQGRTRITPDVSPTYLLPLGDHILNRLKFENNAEGVAVFNKCQDILKNNENNLLKDYQLCLKELDEKYLVDDEKVAMKLSVAKNYSLLGEYDNSIEYYIQSAEVSEQANLTGEVTDEYGTKIQLEQDKARKNLKEDVLIWAYQNQKKLEKDEKQNLIKTYNEEKNGNNAKKYLDELKIYEETIDIIDKHYNEIVIGNFFQTQELLMELKKLALGRRNKIIQVK